MLQNWDHVCASLETTHTHTTVSHTSELTHRKPTLIFFSLICMSAHSATLTQGTSPAFLTWIKMSLDESLKVNVVHFCHTGRRKTRNSTLNLLSLLLK